MRSVRKPIRVLVDVSPLTREQRQALESAIKMAGMAGVHLFAGEPPVVIMEAMNILVYSGKMPRVRASYDVMPVDVPILEGDLALRYFGVLRDLDLMKS